MLTEETLKGSYSEGKALSLCEEVRKSSDFYTFCKTFMHSSDYQVTRNMLWALTKTTEEEHRQLQPLLHPLIELAMATENSSVRRLALSNIERLKIGEDALRSDFLDFCLDSMHDVNELPGIQSLAMKLAYRMCLFYPELMEEMMRVLDSMEMEFYKPAVKSVRNRILKGKLLRRKYYKSKK